jgi:hypothetical protein
MSGSGGRVGQLAEVFERLLKEFGDNAEQRPALFQAALRACAEESRRTKRGQAAAPPDVLVERARELLVPLRPKTDPAPAPPTREAAPGREPVPAPVAPTPVPQSVPAPVVPTPVPELVSAPVPTPVPELAPELVAEPVAAPVPEPVPEPAAPTVPPPPPREDEGLPVYLAPPPPPEEPSAKPASGGPLLEELFWPESAAEFGPGSGGLQPLEAGARLDSAETGDAGFGPADVGEPRLQPVEAAPVRREPLPVGSAGVEPVQATGEGVGPVESRGSRLPRMALGFGLLALVVVAALAWWMLNPSGSRPGAAEPPAAARATAPTSAVAPAAPPEKRGDPSGPAVLPGRNDAPPTPAIQSSGAVSPPAPAPSAASEPPIARAPSVLPSPPAGYAETMASPDWVGHDPTYAVHVSSFQQKSNAERDAARAEQEGGRPASVLRVSVSGRGEFYRVVLGGFESAAAARAYRDEEMADRAAVSQVYWLVPLR